MEHVPRRDRKRQHTRKCLKTLAHCQRFLALIFEELINRCVAWNLPGAPHPTHVCRLYSKRHVPVISVMDPTWLPRFLAGIIFLNLTRRLLECRSPPAYLKFKIKHVLFDVLWRPGVAHSVCQMFWHVLSATTQFNNACIRIIRRKMHNDWVFLRHEPCMPVLVPRVKFVR